jgi:hypothetical protein
MVWVTPETKPFIKTLGARHRASRVQTNTLPSGSTGTVDALPHQRLSHTSPCFCCDPKHPHGGRVRIVHFTERLEAVDERHAADDAAADLRNEDLTVGLPSSDVTQFPLVELVPGIAERAIRRNGQFARDLVLGGPHRPNDRWISCHPPTLSGSSSGREHGEALLDPALKKKKPGCDGKMVPSDRSLVTLPEQAYSQVPDVLEEAAEPLAGEAPRARAERGRGTRSGGPGRDPHAPGTQGPPAGRWPSRAASIS